MIRDDAGRLGPAEERARSAVRELPPARADAAFRARLKRDFVAGRIGEPRALVLPARAGGRAWRVALAATFVVALVVAVAIVNRGPDWNLIATRGDGIAVVGRTPVPLGHSEELARLLRSGGRLQVPEGAEIELLAPGVMAVQVTSGTETVLPRAPGRWFGRLADGAVRHGIVRVTTGPAFRGARLRVDTPEALVQVTGTTLAVICEPAGTCVCVYEGVVRVGAKGGSEEPVAAGRRRFVFNDGRAPEAAEMRPTERERLGALYRSREDWRKPATDR